MSAPFNFRLFRSHCRRVKFRLIDKANKTFFLIAPLILNSNYYTTRSGLIQDWAKTLASVEKRVGKTRSGNYSVCNLYGCLSTTLRDGHQIDNL